ncbi:MAG: hypothetical protein LR001_06980 [Clostridiales bacterium]|nr:hypothetical protein [Clostridiales bacterium]
MKKCLRSNIEVIKGLLRENSGVYVVFNIIMLLVTGLLFRVAEIRWIWAFFVLIGVWSMFWAGINEIEGVVSLSRKRICNLYILMSMFFSCLFALLDTLVNLVNLPIGVDINFFKMLYGNDSILGNLILLFLVLNFTGALVALTGLAGRKLETSNKIINRVGRFFAIGAAVVFLGRWGEYSKLILLNFLVAIGFIGTILVVVGVTTIIWRVNYFMISKIKNSLRER